MNFFRRMEQKSAGNRQQVAAPSSTCFTFNESRVCRVQSKTIVSFHFIRRNADDIPELLR